MLVGQIDIHGVCWVDDGGQHIKKNVITEEQEQEDGDTTTKGRIVRILSIKGDTDRRTKKIQFAEAIAIADSFAHLRLKNYYY